MNVVVANSAAFGVQRVAADETRPIRRNTLAHPRAAGSRPRMDTMPGHAHSGPWNA